MPRRPDGLQRLLKQCRLLKSNSLLKTDWPGVRAVLLWRPEVFIVICWTLKGVQTPSKARPDYCTSVAWLALPRIAFGREHHIVRTVCSCLPISVSETETLLLVEHWMASERYCHVVRTDALEHWILLELLIAAERLAIMSRRMQSWQFEVSWHWWHPDGKFSSSGRLLGI